MNGSTTTDNTSTLAYPHVSGGRDLRLDFLRGLIMLVVITVHLEYYSLLSMFAWGRMGLVSSAEGFVALSGIVLGIVYKKRLFREGFKTSALKMLKRAFQLYRVNLFVILSIALMGMIPYIDTFEVSHWIPVGDKSQVYPLYPPASASWFDIIQQALLLKIGPHQFQVIGLYVVLIAFAPIVLYALYRKKTLWLILASWSIYLINHPLHLRISGALFEWGFPSLSWQLLFINGMIIGYHSEKILGFIADKKNRLIAFIAGFLSLAFIFLALNNPNQVFWPWRTFSLIDSATYHDMYLSWFQKSLLGFGRVFNNLVLFIVAYYMLTHYWLPINKTLGWLLIPLGQASLYVFFVHVYFVLLVSNTPIKEFDNFYINTAVQITTILLIWLMVKKHVLFQLIPR